MKLYIFALACAAHAAPVAAQVGAPLGQEAIAPQAARLLDRAAKVYGSARSFSFSYTTRVPEQKQPTEKGRVLWMRPAMYSHTLDRGDGPAHFAIDGQSVRYTTRSRKQGRFLIGKGRTFWQAVPMKPPMYYLASFTAGKSPLQDEIDAEFVRSVGVLESQKIGGATCDGVVIQLRTPNPFYEGMVRGSVRLWFDRATGLTRRQSWSFLKAGDPGVKTTTTDYLTKLNPALQAGDFLLKGEKDAPLGEDPSGWKPEEAEPAPKPSAPARPQTESAES